MGAFHVGIRASTLELHELITSALAEHLVEDPRARPSYAIRETRAELSTAKPLFQVYRDCVNLLTTRSTERAVSFLAAQLEQHLPFRPPPDHVLDLDAVALMGGRSALLAPGTLLARCPDIELRLGRFGLGVLELPRVWVDVRSPLVIVPPRRLTMTGFRETEERHERRAVTAPGEYELRAWVFLSSPAESGPITRATAVARGLLAANRQPPRDALPMLGSLVEHLEVVTIQDVGELPVIARATLDGAS